MTKAGSSQTGRETPVFVRFSTVLGSRGSADTARDIRGFAVKFYTDEGNFDLVGNNIPVFFIQDGIKFPDLIHAVKPEPDREIPQAQSAHDTFWDFVSLHPESTHMLMWAMSDRAIPRSYRTMEGFGVHTFRLVDADGTTTLVKFHWKPVAGVHRLVWEEAQKLGGVDPDFHRRDLHDAIGPAPFPQWELGIQVMPDTEDQTFEGIDLLDPTKLVPEELAPCTVGHADPRPQPDELLRRDRAGRLPHRATSSPASRSSTTRCCRPGCSPTSTPSSPASADRTSARSRSTGRTHRSTTCYRDGFHQQAVHEGVAPVPPTPSAADARSSPPPRTAAYIDVPATGRRRPKVRELPAALRRPLHAGDAVLRS